jgi:hypothetical protein
MMKNIILLFILSLAFTVSNAQEKEHVIDYLENRIYSDKSPAEYLIDDQKFEIPEAFLEDILGGFEAGINSRARFGIATKGKMQTSKYDTEGSAVLFKKKPAHYMFVLKVLNFETIKNEEDSGGKLKFDADIKCFDLIKGTIVMQRNVKMDGNVSSIHLLQYSSTPTSKDIAKAIKETTIAGIEGVFPSSNFITKLDEVKGDKVKSIKVGKHRHNMQGSPKYAYAHIVDKELEINGKRVFTFTLIGQLRSPTSAGSEVIFKVGDGKKQILSAFNEGKDIFVFPTQLGPEK